MRNSRIAPLISAFQLLPRYVFFAYPAVVLFALSPLIQLAFFSHPVADDFCHGTNADESLFEVLSKTAGSIVSVYYSFSGNYFSEGLLQLIPGLIDFTRWYAVIPLALLSLTFLGILYLVRAAFGSVRFTLPMVLIASCCTAMFVINMPSTAQGLYWLAAGGQYYLGSTLILFIVSLLIRLSQQEDTVEFRSSLFIGLVVLLTMAAGTHVMVLISLLAIMIGLVIREVFYRGKQRFPLVILMVLVLVLAYISVSAPGNYQRSLLFPHGGQFWFSISGAIYWGMRNVARWVGNPLLWISTGIVIYCFTMLPARQTGKYRPNRVFIWLFPLLSLSYLAVLHFPHLWSTGVKPSDRVENAIYFVFLLLWFWYAFICYRSLLAFGRTAWCLPRVSAIPGFAISLLLIVFTILVYVHPTMRLARLDLVGRAHAFHATNLERYRLLEAYQAGDEVPVVVPDYAGIDPLTIYVSSITSNPGYWENQCMAKYFGVDSVVMAR